MEEVPRQPPFLKTATFLPFALMNLAPKDLISPSQTAALPPGNCKTHFPESCSRRSKQAELPASAPFHGVCILKVRSRVLLHGMNTCAPCNCGVKGFELAVKLSRSLPWHLRSGPCRRSHPLRRPSCCVPCRKLQQGTPRSHHDLFIEQAHFNTCQEAHPVVFNLKVLPF